MTPSTPDRHRGLSASLLVVAIVVSIAGAAVVGASATIAVLAAWLGIATGATLILATSCGDAVSLEHAPPSPATPVWPERHGATFDPPLEPEAIVRVPDAIQRLADWHETRDRVADVVEYLARLASVHQSEPVTATDIARAAARLLESPRFRAELEARSLRRPQRRLPIGGVVA